MRHTGIDQVDDTAAEARLADHAEIFPASGGSMPTHVSRSFYPPSLTGLECDAGGVFAIPWTSLRIGTGRTMFGTGGIKMKGRKGRHAHGGVMSGGRIGGSSVKCSWGKEECQCDSA